MSEQFLEWPSKRKRVICDDYVHESRPERGPVVKCTNRARYAITNYRPVKYVCGWHARAYLNPEPL